MIEGFTPAAPIPEDVIARYAPHVPPGVVEMWRENGTGWFADGFFRVVDPAHAEQMLDNVYPFPPPAVVLFTTALADLVVWRGDTFYLIKWRWGLLEALPRSGDLTQVLTWMRDPELLQQYFEWEPYPEAARRDGVPGLDDCFGFVPLLALGGPPTADHLEPMEMWVHIALILQLAGKPRAGGEFAPPDPSAS
jgi:hypothetical protein